MSTRAGLLLLTLGLFAIGTDGYVINGLLPDITQDLHVSDSTAGLLITAFAFAYAIGARAEHRPAATACVPPQR